MFNTDLIHRNRFFRNDGENLMGYLRGRETMGHVPMNYTLEQRYEPEGYYQTKERIKREDELIQANNANPLASPRPTIRGGRKTLFK